jgi:plasmid stabilization system protein ParE
VSKRKVVWSDWAKLSLQVHHDYIKQDSAAAARRVKSEIIKASKDLARHPEMYRVDEYYPNNPGNIRIFFRWSYRIVYQVNEANVAILNVLHTSR